MAAFVIVHAEILRRTIEEIFLTFQSFSLLVLPPAAKNTGAIKICLFVLA